MNAYEVARQALVADLRRYLVGPLSGPDEIVDEPPADRYHLGMLAPSGTGLAPEEDDQDAGGDAGGPDAASSDGILALANIAKQAAAGMTFQVPFGSDVLVDLSFGDYEFGEHLVGDQSPEAGRSGSAPSPAGNINPAKDALTKAEGSPAEVPLEGETPGRRLRGWKRSPVTLPGMKIPKAIGLSPAAPVLIGAVEGIEVLAFGRRTGDVCAITVSVVNRRPRRAPRGPEGRSTESHRGVRYDGSIYQVMLRARAPEHAAVFVARPPGIHISDDEFVAHEVLYRDVRQFAVGHGCAVDWVLPSPSASTAVEIHSDWIPAVEVYKASADVASLSDSAMLDLDFLAGTDAAAACAELRNLAAAYSAWIAEVKARSPDVIGEFDERLRDRVTAVMTGNLRACERVRDRIVEGVNCLETSPVVYESFRMANEAMAASMRRSRPDRAPRWFPFQLAFILMALCSSVDETHPDREVMDLIWFPTGGGKTEAYLGLLALVLFHRRLASDDKARASGTAVLTRYTLRLLTVQQFERAARAVMACELIRRRDPLRLGTTAFTIGLFVGNSATPGTLDNARQIIAGAAQPDETATTLPLVKCPWCSHPLSFRDQRVEGNAVVTRCPASACEFQEGIPFACVDEHLYAIPPTVVIGTVDKFAMMAWQPRIRELFGLGIPRRDPPSLIIQDELHLIGDALGTVTALYETAVDFLCSRDGRGPKIVGSTATIRRAGEQIRAIYNRGVEQFPPSGIDYNDSFFYSEDRSVPGRLYVGVHAQGRSPKFTLARVMGVLAQGAESIPDPAVRDHYYTLVAYFNSLRELGGAIVLAYDDVRRYIESMPIDSGHRRRLSVVQELTSHIPSQEIPEVLARIARSICDVDVNSEAIDLVLSTNMISVGVDVDRLGVMVINGQPKTTSEYIQASSRVGRPRGSAGLVVALYNWTRPRDRSHYERFRAYHSSFYRYVEATSVTPFSARARDRALHGVLFSMARLWIPELAQDPSTVNDPVIAAQLERLCENIAARAAQVEAAETGHTEEDLEYLLEDWKLEATRGATWGRESNSGAPHFLCPPASNMSDAVFSETLQSMRDVDPPAPVQLLNYRELAAIFGESQP